MNDPPDKFQPDWVWWSGIIAKSGPIAIPPGFAGTFTNQWGPAVNPQLDIGEDAYRGLCDVLKGKVIDELKNELHNESDCSCKHWIRVGIVEIASRNGYYKAIVTDKIRGTPPPGTIWLRPSPTGRGIRTKRKVKRGRPLTIKELVAVLETL